MDAGRIGAAMDGRGHVGRWQTLYASVYPGLIYSFAMKGTTTGSAGFVSGARFDGVDLQYFGGGVFSVVGSTGVPSFQ